MFKTKRNSKDYLKKYRFYEKVKRGKVKILGKNMDSRKKVKTIGRNMDSRKKVRLSKEKWILGRK